MFITYIHFREVMSSRHYIDRHTVQGLVNLLVVVIHSHAPAYKYCTRNQSQGLKRTGAIFLLTVCSWCTPSQSRPSSSSLFAHSVPPLNRGHLHLRVWFILGVGFKLRSQKFDFWVLAPQNLKALDSRLSALGFELHALAVSFRLEDFEVEVWGLGFRV